MPLDHAQALHVLSFWVTSLQPHLPRHLDGSVGAVVRDAVGLSFNQAADAHGKVEPRPPALHDEGGDDPAMRAAESIRNVSSLL